MHDSIYIIFLFALGSCVGSFLNVVVWRLPRGESLVTPPSHCPKCNKQLQWYDNIPILGWIKLAGKCRYCAQPISVRYPLVELLTALLFVFYYVMFFIVQVGPCHPQRPLDITEDWPIYGLYMATIAALLAASLIDLELFIIPVEIPWLIAVLGIVVHAIVDRPPLPGALNLNAPTAALAAGAGAGLLCSIVLWAFDVMPTSFPDGEPLLEHERQTGAGGD
jgi:leader peptidase (prepilin peptidase)/N-methyltransferase